MKYIFITNRYGQLAALNFDLRHGEDSKIRKMIPGVISAAMTAKNFGKDRYITA